MRSVSANAYSAMRVLDYRIVTNDNGAVYSSADIISMDIQRKLTDKGVSIGNAISDRLSVMLRKSENDIPKKTRFTVYVKFGNDASFTMIGRFYVDKCVKSKHGYLNVTCTDFLALLDKECKWKANSRVQALTFPATHQQILDYIITRYNLTCDFSCEDWTVDAAPEGYTYRQILSFIAASHAANVQIDEDGAVTFVQFCKDNTVTYPLSASNVISQTIDETAGYTVNGIYIEVDDNTDIYIDDVEGSEYDEDAVGIVKVKNPFATVAIAKYCWKHLGRLSYISTTITKRATTALQCGDVINVYDYAGEPAELKAAVTAIHYTVSASGGFQEQITSYADTGENKKTTPNKKAEKKNAIPQDFFSAADPALTASNKVKTNDKWYVRDNDTDKHLTMIKCRKLVSEATSEHEAVYEWEIECVVPSGGSGGVGEDLGNGNERFNDYTDNDITGNSDHSTVKGWNNTLANCIRTFAGGTNNTISNDHDSSFFYGGSNVTNNTNRCGGMGNNNRMSDCTGSFFFGEQNTIAKGEGMFDPWPNYCFAVGYHNIVTGYNAAAIGEYCTASTNHSLAVGQYASTAGGKLLAVGDSTGHNFEVMNGSSGHVRAWAYDSLGADYGEYFEWFDGNFENEYRMGLLVDVDNGKIVPAHGDDFIGAISARACVIGNSYENHWHGKFVTNVYGELITVNGEPLISPDYDPEREYVPRSQRPEWDVVGLVGCIIVRDDGTCMVGKYVSARNGIGTNSYKRTPARVLRRIDKMHVEVLIK